MLAVQVLWQSRDCRLRLSNLFESGFFEVDLN